MKIFMLVLLIVGFHECFGGIIRWQESDGDWNTQVRSADNNAGVERKSYDSENELTDIATNPSADIRVSLSFGELQSWRRLAQGRRRGRNIPNSLDHRLQLEDDRRQTDDDNSQMQSGRNRGPRRRRVRHIVDYHGHSQSGRSPEQQRTDWRHIGRCHCPQHGGRHRGPSRHRRRHIDNYHDHRPPVIYVSTFEFPEVVEQEWDENVELNLLETHDRAGEGVDEMEMFGQVSVLKNKPVTMTKKTAIHTLVFNAPTLLRKNIPS